MQATGRLVEGLARFEDLGRLVASGSLRLGSNLEPGEYVLQVVAWDKLAPGKFRVASQWTDLELVP